MLNKSDDIRPVDGPKSSQPQDMSADQPVSNRTSEVPDTLLPLSPLIENVNEEDCGTDEGQFADALEEITLVEEKVEEESSSKRDSKIEDDFEEAKEHLSVSNETVNMEEKERSAPEAAPEENPEQQQQQARSIDDDEESNKPGPPSGSVLFLLILGLCLAVLLVSLDRTIITTAIPAITNEFHSTAAVGWYGSSYLVTACALQPTYGRIFTLFDVKWTFLHAVGLFELGSLICAVAPNSTTLIVGRAIAGWGSAGILTGAFVVVAYAVPLQKRPLYTAAIGMMYGAGAATGPLLGGVFSGMVTWRWCFYFNLPVGSVTLFVIAFFFKPVKTNIHTGGFLRRIRQLDITGSALVLLAFTMLFLALEYNNEGYPWSSSLVISLLCGFGVVLVIFIAWQAYRKEKALIVPSILMRRTVTAACLLAFFIYSALILHGYYLPIWFQAIKGVSTEQSGLNMLPYVLPNAAFSLFTGIFVTKTGYFTPPAIIGCAVAMAGSGLISTLDPATGTAKWAGYICLVAVGVGAAIQQSFTAVQSVLRLDQVPIATAAVTCFQSLGGAIFISIGNSILSNDLRRASRAKELPGIDIESVIAAGATQFRQTVPAGSLPDVINVYNNALQKVFIAAIPLTGLAFVSTLLLEWRNVKAPRESQMIERTITPLPVLPEIDVEARISPVTTNIVRDEDNNHHNNRSRYR